MAAMKRALSPPRLEEPDIWWAWGGEVEAGDARLLSVAGRGLQTTRLLPAGSSVSNALVVKVAAGLVIAALLALWAMCEPPPSAAASNATAVNATAPPVRAGGLFTFQLQLPQGLPSLGIGLPAGFPGFPGLPQLPLGFPLPPYDDRGRAGDSRGQKYLPDLDPFSGPAHAASGFCGVKCTVAVWTARAGKFKCGQRVVFLRSWEGGGQSEADACQQVSSRTPVGVWLLVPRAGRAPPHRAHEFFCRVHAQSVLTHGFQRCPAKADPSRAALTQIAEDEFPVQCGDCSPYWATPVCANSCAAHPLYSGDGVCDDGGPGSEWSACDYGADCDGAPPPALPHHLARTPCGTPLDTRVTFL